MKRSKKRRAVLATVFLILIVWVGAAVFGPTSVRCRVPFLPPIGRDMVITEVLPEITSATRLDVPDYAFSGHLEEEKSREAWEFLKDVRISFIGFGEGKDARKRQRSDQPVWLWGLNDRCIFVFEEDNPIMTVKIRGKLTARYSLKRDGEAYIPEDMYVWLWNTLLVQGHPRRPDRVDETEPISRSSDRNGGR